MTTEILDRAEISGENVIVEYSATEAALSALRQKYAGIVFDLTTVKGDKEARADALAAQQAEIDRQARELREAQEAQAKAEADRIRKEAEEKARADLLAENAAQQGNATPVPEPASDPYPPALTLDKVLNLVAPVEKLISIAEPAPDNGARLKLGELNARLAPLSITADGLAELGFKPVSTQGNAKLYREADYPLIVDALIQRLLQAKSLQVA